MRRLAILTARALLVLALVAAVADVHLPGASKARRRLHLIDRSGSVRVKGPTESLDLHDARRMVEWDEASREPGDTVSWASFGADLAFESETVDPAATDLEAALEGALARDPTEIVLHTDGRADPGRALFLCRERSVPVHVYPLGPTSVRDARIDRVRAPAEAAPDEDVAVEVTVAATFEGTVRLRMDGDAREVRVGPGAPAVVSFPRRGPGAFTLKLEPEDDCEDNNAAAGRIEPKSTTPRILTLAPGTPFDNPRPYAAVVLDNARLKPGDRKALADYVRKLGGGLLLLGGGNSFAEGDWKGTVLEALSPVRVNPDQRLAVVFAIDSSGSMSQPPEKLRDVLAAVRRAWSLREEGDHIAAFQVSGQTSRFITDPAGLRDIRPGGGTIFAEAMDKAREYLREQRAGRHQLVFLTDGETSRDETPQMRRDAFRRLEEAGIGLTVVTTDRELEVGRHVPIDGWSELEGEMGRIVSGLRETVKANPGPLDLSEHEVTRGVGRIALPWMNLTTAKQGAEVIGRVGQPPFVYSAVAFHRVGRGRVGALTFRREDVPPRLLAQAIRYVSGGAGGGPELSIDYPVVRARGEGPPRLEATFLGPSNESGTIALDQIRSDLWEGRLPATKPGTVTVRLGLDAASATVPTAEEYRALGVDAGALHRIAEATGGSVLRSPEALTALPRPERGERVSGRPFFLLTALLLLFLELALTTFWKENRAAPEPRSP